jgi:hypothetical protein
MKQDRRERAARLSDDLHRSTAPEALAVKELVDLLLEEAKHKLVSSEGEMTLRLQGEARAFKDLSDKLRHGVPTMREQ